MSEEEGQISDIEGNENPEQVKGNGKSKNRNGKSKNGNGKSKNRNGKSKNGKGNVEQKTESEPPKQGDRITTKDGKEYIIGESMGNGSSRSCYALLDNEGNKTGLVILFDKEVSTKKKKEENEKYKQVSEKIKETESDFILKPVETGKKNGYNYEISRIGKDLPKFIKNEENKGKITEVSLMVSLFLGLKNLHEKHILHNDLKNDNILIINKNDSYIPVIMDFDQSRIYDADKDKEIDFGEGERPYGISPENFKARFCVVKNPENINPFKSDIYSIGAILYEFISGEEIYKSEEKIVKEFSGMRVDEPLPPVTMVFKKTPMIQKEEERVSKGENGKLETYLISEIENCNNFSFMKSEKCKDPDKIEKAKQMFVDIFKGIFQFDEKKRDDLNKVFEKIDDFLKYLVNDMNLDPSEDLKIPNEALKELGLENLAENKQEEQKNEKSTNKISNMNFTAVQDYNENSRSLVSSDSSFFDSESENQQKDEKAEIKEENLELSDFPSSEPEISLSEIEDKEMEIGNINIESLKDGLEKNKSNSNRLEMNEKRIIVNAMTNDVRKIGNENEKTTERSFS